MAGICSVSLINNSVSNESRGDCFDILGKSDKSDDTTNTIMCRQGECVIQPLVQMPRLFPMPINEQHCYQPLPARTGIPGVGSISSPVTLTVGLLFWQCVLTETCPFKY